MPVVEIPTSEGDARAVVAPAAGAARGLAAFGHGAGGGLGAPDLVAVTAALGAAGWTVAGVEQPYRVRGSRMPDRAPRLDAAWTEVVARLRDDVPGPLLVGGRSSGARVACRTAGAVGAQAVVCLAFPLHPPGRPDKSRADELRMVGVPTLVVQGERDPFGRPADVSAAVTDAPVTVCAVAGDHSLRRTSAVTEAVLGWLAGQRLA
ncbi:MAG: alpha/beta hydrolase [Frankiales bacterium]|nr:alpha/beta hydrolase [Frankiales bacterium]